VCLCVNQAAHVTLLLINANDDDDDDDEAYSVHVEHVDTEVVRRQVETVEHLTAHTSYVTTAVVISRGNAALLSWRTATNIEQINI